MGREIEKTEHSSNPLNHKKDENVSLEAQKAQSPLNFSVEKNIRRGLDSVKVSKH